MTDGGNGISYDHADWADARIVCSAGPVPPTVTITAPDATATEARPTTGYVTVTRSGATTSALTVNVTVTGTATSGSDYNSIGTSITIPAGSSTADITITPINDSIDENDETVIVTLSVNAAYTAGSPSAATVTITDDDTAGITVNPTSGLVTTEAGATASFAIVLNSQPTGNVTIGLSSSDTTEGTVSPASATFTAANWAVPQTVTMTGVDDATADGNVAYTIVTAAATSADAAYSGMNAADVSATNNDNEVSSFTYLSDLIWISATNGWGPVEKDKSNGEKAAGDGRTITLNGVTYAKGLGVVPLSDIRYGLSGQCAQFISDIGVDDEVGANGSVVFQVYGDGVKLYDSGLMTGSSATKQVTVDISGKSTLQLVVTDGGNGISYDHADWADARIVCSAGAD